MQYNFKILLIILISLFCVFIIGSQPVIVLENKEINLNLNGEYIKEYAYFKVPFKKDIKILSKNTVDTSKVGKNTVKYEIKYKNKIYTKLQIVNVKDLEKPIIILKGETSKKVCPKDEYVEEGYEASDNYDGDITNQVKIEKQHNKYIYEVVDSSLNSFSIERKIIHEDKEAPTIKLHSNEVVVYLNDPYIESGYEVSDNCDSNISNNVKISGAVNVNLKGTYELKYTIEDSALNISEITKIVRVIDKPVNNGKVIYLTFDDGPSSITPAILDVLKEENIKATFFVINHSDSYNYLIKRAHDEGHTIAIHSYSHNYKYIYQSESNFFNDLTLMENKINSIIGIKPKIIRFPGGSSNTVSKFNPKIMTKLTSEVGKRGYIYFDWNISSGDAGDTKNPNQIFRNVTSSLGSKENIVLMHDTGFNVYTLNALRDIIKYGKNQGYIFDSLNESVKPARHRVVN